MEVSPSASMLSHTAVHARIAAQRYSGDVPPATKTRPHAASGAHRPARSTSELALIERIRARAATTAPHLRLGIGDDCAILAPPAGCDLLVTTDFSLEGRHFRRRSGNAWHSPASIGHRTLARGLSDLAAMGATPLSCFLSLSLPRDIASDLHWIDGFLDGFLALAAIHSVPLAGGDTSESPNAIKGKRGYILADIVLLGTAPRHRALRRSTARPGDFLYVTGQLGGASVELHSFSNDKRGNNQHTNTHVQSPGASLHPHLFPQPRIAVGRALLRRSIATACIDLSDGLSTDLTHLCTGSRVGAEIDPDALPLHPLTASLQPQAALSAALHGGEDYELLFTAASSTKVPRSIAGVGVTRIGRIVSPRKGRPTITLIDNELHRTPLEPGGWEHLK